MRCFAAGCVVWLVACGASGVSPTGSGSTASGSVSDGSDVSSGADRSTGSDDSLSEGDCLRLADHVLELARVAQASAVEARYRPTPEQVEELRPGLREALLPLCAQLSRSGWRCALGAATFAAYARCGRAPTPGPIPE